MSVIDEVGDVGAAHGSVAETPSGEGDSNPHGTTDEEREALGESSPTLSSSVRPSMAPHLRPWRPRATPEPRADGEDREQEL